MLSIANETDFKVEHGLYVIKFWATWCMPCKAYAPTIEKLDEEFENISFISIDVDQVPELAQKFKIKSLPSLVIIKDGVEVDRVLGATYIAPLRTKFKELNNSFDDEQEDISAVAQ